MRQGRHSVGFNAAHGPGDPHAVVRVSIDTLILGLLAGIRPATSQAAVFALLRAENAARSLLAFAVAGFACSTGLGLVLVVAFDGAGGAFGRSTFTEMVYVVAGVAALGFAAGVARGTLDRRRPRERGARAARLAARLHHPSIATAAAAGVATHVPALLYLVALNSIAADRPGFAEAAVQVLTYNLLWFALPFAALVIAIRSPASARAVLDGATAWAQRHQEPLLVALFGVFGVYFTAKGVIGLAD